MKKQNTSKKSDTLRILATSTENSNKTKIVTAKQAIKVLMQFSSISNRTPERLRAMLQDGLRIYTNFWSFQKIMCICTTAYVDANCKATEHDDVVERTDVTMQEAIRHKQIPAELQQV